MVTEKKYENRLISYDFLAKNDLKVIEEHIIFTLCTKIKNLTRIKVKGNIKGSLKK